MRPILDSEVSRKRRTNHRARRGVLISVWRDGDDAAQNADSAGFIVSSGEFGAQEAAQYWGRFHQMEQAEVEEEFGAEMVNTPAYTFLFTKDADLALNPDIRGGDTLKVAGRSFEVLNPGGDDTTQLHRVVRCIEILG